MGIPIPLEGAKLGLLSYLTEDLISFARTVFSNRPSSTYIQNTALDLDRFLLLLDSYNNES